MYIRKLNFQSDMLDIERRAKNIFNHFINSVNRFAMNNDAKNKFFHWHVIIWIDSYVYVQYQGHNFNYLAQFVYYWQRKYDNAMH